ncbi:MBL fold metallo-hydrolase [Aduncisulcus paluster]|uniref:MBL fold metallo-hydrolase n=1 Tax=Aduncisulcus paluster TaxID=2918883 RepID=A0ABQ5KH10_9EUKA|nr:MBL fold metallo-hydrolase [Aduncisulcus paluster]
MIIVLGLVGVVGVKLFGILKENRENFRVVLDNERLHVVTVPAGVLQANCILVADKLSKNAVIVDAGGDPGKEFLSVISDNGYFIKYILATHAHFDHVAGFSKMKKRFPEAKVGVHISDKELYVDVPKQPALFNLPKMGSVPDCDILLKDKQILHLGAIGIKVIHTPGHSPGGVLFDIGPGDVLLTGDTLMMGGFGRTDLWGGSSKALEKSFSKFSTFPDDMIIVSGHGPETTIGYERKWNFYSHFMKFKQRSIPSDTTRTIDREKKEDSFVSSSREYL